MAKIYLLILLITLTGVVNSQQTDVLPRMSGGVNTVIGEYPSAVYIETDAPPGNCVGVIVNPTHIVTSVRCVVNSTNHLLNPFWLRVVSGDLNLGSPSFRRFTTNVTHIYTHPQVILPLGSFDIAVLRVGSPFPFPHNTIDLVPRNTVARGQGTLCEFVGWGSPTIDGAFNLQQQKLYMQILLPNQCQQQGPQIICAGAVGAASGVCSGNIGGGLYCNNLLTGILTAGLGCATGTPPGAYTDIRHFNDWIQQQFLRTDFVMPGTPVVALAT